MLSDNLAELTTLLRSEGVQAHSHLFDANEQSLKTLTHFLKRYSKGLATDAPLRAQRHKLEFVLPCASIASFLSVCAVVGTFGAWSAAPSVPTSSRARRLRKRAAQCSAAGN